MTTHYALRTRRGKDIEKHIESLSAGSAPASASSSPNTVAPPSHHENWGVIPRAVESLFEELRAISRHGAAAIVYCSYMQIYNNDVYDLLQENKQRMKEPLAVREMIKGNSKQVYVSGLSEFRVASLDETLKLLKAGNRNRTIRATEYNEKSSRSHALLQISAEVESRGMEGATTIIRRAKLNLVDLAGSEKWDTDVSMGSDRCKELTAINQSLSALGNVISALTKPKRTHIPYRDSKLTRLLQDSLGGNTRTVVIATISPSETALDETISTLQFADRAKSILVRVKVNEMVDDAILLARAQREIARLKVLLKQSGSQQQVVELEEQVAKLKKENAALTAENKRLRKNASTSTSASRGSSDSVVAGGDVVVSSGTREQSGGSRSMFGSGQDKVSSPPPKGDRNRTLQSEGSKLSPYAVRAAHPAQPLNQLRLDLVGAAAPFDASALTRKSKAFAAFPDADDDNRLQERLDEAEREHERILRGIQTERRELEHQLEQLSLSQSTGGGNDGGRMNGCSERRQGNNSETLDDGSDELCPMCGRSIDDHSDAALDICIEKEELEMKARQVREHPTRSTQPNASSSKRENAGNQQVHDDSARDQLKSGEQRPGPQIASVLLAPCSTVEPSAASATTSTAIITPWRVSTSAGSGRPSPYLQDVALKPSTPSTQSKAKPFVKCRSLREGGGVNNSTRSAITGGGASRPAASVSASSRDEQEEPTPTSFVGESNQLESLPGDVPILRHSHKSVKALKKLHALSPYNLKLLKRAGGAASDKNTPAALGGTEHKPKSDANAHSSVANSSDTKLVTNSVRDIGLKLSVYKFRCALLGIIFVWYVKLLSSQLLNTQVRLLVSVRRRGLRRQAQAPLLPVRVRRQAVDGSQGAQGPGRRSHRPRRRRRR